MEGTPLLSTPLWLPDEPVELDHIKLRYIRDATFAGIAGTETLIQRLLPTRAEGTRYYSYSEAVAALAPPAMFDNRVTYRLLHADLHRSPQMVFGRGHYFDGIDVGEAAAHEFTGATLGEIATHDLRDGIGDPCDPGRRSVNIALSTPTLRYDPNDGSGDVSAAPL